jgi:hypothetical protein
MGRLRLACLARSPADGLIALAIACRGQRPGHIASTRPLLPGPKPAARAQELPSEVIDKDSS